MIKYYIALGSNIGDKVAYLNKAIVQLNEHKDIEVVSVSKFLTTEPWGNINQDKFVNAVCIINTELPPIKLLALTQQIELECGRVRHEHWGPRTLDLDLIYAVKDSDIITVKTDELVLPHPYFWERNFVLEPLAELEPNFIFNNQKVLDRISELKVKG